MIIKQNKGNLPFVERDISWLYFNHRILEEAKRKDVPLLERFNFLGIYSNNLDEYFRVRVAAQQQEALYKKAISKKGRERARSTLREIYKIVEKYACEFEEAYNLLVKDLAKEGIFLINEQDLTLDQQKEVLSFYIDKLSGSTNPLFFKRMKFSSEEMDEALYLAVDLQKISSSNRIEKEEIALIKVPTDKFGRFLRLKDKEGKLFFMYLDDVIRFCMPYIFIGADFNSFKAYSFKFTKNAEMDLDKDIRFGLMQKISRGLKSREHGELLRLVFDRTMPKSIESELTRFAEIDQYDAKISGGRYHNSKDLMSLPLFNRPDLENKPQLPLQGCNLNFSKSIIDEILKKDRGLHFPYRSFDCFLRLLREAAIRPDVNEIKVTLYRLAKGSHVVEALKAAAANGKKVTAVVELLARFDEPANLIWSREMEAAGIRVVFGPEALKVHSKLVYISCKKGAIACIGTGNMHEGTAKLYTDYMMMSARKEIVQEVGKVLDFIERPFVSPRFSHLLVSPKNMRNKLIALIDKEMKNAKAGKTAFIKIKINHITDERIIAKLYAAGRAGVEIKLLVRGNCSLVPQVEGVSPNIVQYGIIDRYLEHSRILIFGNGGNTKYYIGSADWMERNLDRRIEVMAPVYDKDIQNELMTIVDLGLSDISQSHYVNYNEGKPRRENHPKPWLRSQEELYNYYLRLEQKEEE